MKKIALTLCLIFIACTCTANEFMCLHYKDDPLSTCQFLSEKLNFNQESYSEYTGQKYSVIWLSGFGTPDGFWTDKTGGQKIPWNELTGKWDCDYLVVDTCYSGKIFDYPHNMVVISSTNADSISINTSTEGWATGSVSSLASMIYCISTQDQVCKGYKGCTDDPQLCQMSMILEELQSNWIQDILLSDFKDHPNISFGTAMFNGEPWR